MWNLTPSFLYIRIRATHCHRHCNPDFFSYLIYGGVAVSYTHLDVYKRQVKADCKVEKIDSFYTVLKRTEMLTVNVEELNYLAKRLDSFDTGEAAQFQAMAHKLELFELKDLINLTFCCQQATVITDFSDLAAVGRDHYMNLHGGSASVDKLNALDGKETARQLIENGGGTITPYGVVYDLSLIHI